MAKTALSLQVAGLDTTAFPTPEGNRNLVKEVRSVRNADGSFGASDFPFVHSLAMFALARSPGGVPMKSVRWLQNQQCTTAGNPNRGSYGSGGCSAADADATALAIQALRAAGVPAMDPTVKRAGDWLSRRQKPSGGFASSYGTVNSNTTGLATQALRDLNRTGAATAGARFIKGLQVNCTSLKGSNFTSADIGAIAYDRLAWNDARGQGITSVTVGQWLRAGTQATLALRGSRFDQLSAASARPGLPKGNCTTQRSTDGLQTIAMGDKQKSQ